MNLFFNGEIIQENALRLSHENRALNFGDGLFETMKFADRKALYLNDHFKRMLAGSKALRLKLPEYLTLDYLEKSLEKLAMKNSQANGRIKILVWRKSGGLFSPATDEIEYLIVMKEWQSSPAEKKKVIISTERKNYSSLSGFKVLSSVIYVMAGIEMKEKKADDVVILNHNQEVVECLSSNIFWEKDSKLFTPAVETGCIEGVMRKQIIQKLKNQNIEVLQGHYTANELLKADFAFCSNIGGLSRINSIENTDYRSSSEIFNRLQASFH